VKPFFVKSIEDWIRGVVTDLPLEKTPHAKAPSRKGSAKISLAA
jgi:hypothetical protein